MYKAAKKYGKVATQVEEALDQKYTFSDGEGNMSKTDVPDPTSPTIKQVD